MINFCHIVPTSLLKEYTVYSGCHLILAHLVEKDDSYCRFYRDISDGKKKIMDNSAFEMYKQGKPMYDCSKLIDIGNRVNADMIVMSDYPKESGIKTINAAKSLASALKHNGFETFFCPQSQLGDMDDLMLSLEWAIDNKNLIDRIGISILNCPIAHGVQETKTGDEAQRSDSFRLQRFMSRWSTFLQMEKRGLLNDLQLVRKRFHCLGMTDGPREIELLKPYHNCIASWDSSAAVWAGLNGIEFDKSPTGLFDGKFEKEVDFDWVGKYDEQLVRHNIQYINRLCK